MVLKSDQQRIKALLTETITLLCKNGLQFYSELTVEALVGITLDQSEVFLVSIKETISTPESKALQSAKVHCTSSLQEVKLTPNDRPCTPIHRHQTELCRLLSNSVSDSSHRCCDAAQAEESCKTVMRDDPAKSSISLVEFSCRGNTDMLNCANQSGGSEEDTTPSIHHVDGSTGDQTFRRSSKRKAKDMAGNEVGRRRTTDDECLVLKQETVDSQILLTAFDGSLQYADCFESAPDGNMPVNLNCSQAQHCSTATCCTVSTSNQHAVPQFSDAHVQISTDEALRIASSNRLVSCDDCKILISSLDEVSTVHAGHKIRKSYPCPYCRKLFTNTYNLRGHLSDHTGIKEFVCPVCGHEHALKHHLVKHMSRKHNMVCVDK